MKQKKEIIIWHDSMLIGKNKNELNENNIQVKSQEKEIKLKGNKYNQELKQKEDKYKKLENELKFRKRKKVKEKNE